MPTPIQTATLQAAVLSTTSSILAQLLTFYRDSAFPETRSTLNPMGLDFVPILRFLFFTVLNTPPNFLWQEYLEKKFPKYSTEKGKQKLKVDDGGKVRAMKARGFAVCVKHKS